MHKPFARNNWGDRPAMIGSRFSKIWNIRGICEQTIRLSKKSKTIWCESPGMKIKTIGNSDFYPKDTRSWQWFRCHISLNNSMSFDFMYWNIFNKACGHNGLIPQFRFSLEPEIISRKWIQKVGRNLRIIFRIKSLSMSGIPLISLWKVAMFMPILCYGLGFEHWGFEYRSQKWLHILDFRIYCLSHQGSIWDLPRIRRGSLSTRMFTPLLLSPFQNSETIADSASKLLQRWFFFKYCWIWKRKLGHQGNNRQWDMSPIPPFQGNMLFRLRIHTIWILMLAKINMFSTVKQWLSP
jgi:hypothetical protein